MKIYQEKLEGGNWTPLYKTSNAVPVDCQVTLVFGARNLVSTPSVYEYIKAKYHNADIVLASTSGEIVDNTVKDDTVIVTAIHMERSKVKCVNGILSITGSSFDLGAQLMRVLNGAELKSVMVISDGSHVNGTELVAGFNSENVHNVTISGGLAGDGADFDKTATGLNCVPHEKNVIAIGFYGENVVVNHGSFGGWDEFGTERKITKSAKNILHELDGKSALILYKEYLGDYANELPGSALLFPLALKSADNETTLVRTILSIDEEADTMTFAGNMPEGAKVRLMKANFDKLIDGSSEAAQQSIKDPEVTPGLAILISCVGRKLILQQRTEEEVEAAREIFGPETAICGFYSYGELSPYTNSGKCELHNQTMTITTLAEKP